MPVLENVLVSLNTSQIKRKNTTSSKPIQAFPSHFYIIIMSKKLDPASTASKAKINPFTPMRRFFFKLELLKPIVALGKRVRDQSYAADKSLAERLLEQKSSRSLDFPLLGSSSFVASTTAVRNATFVKDLIQPQQHRQGTARIGLQQYDQPLDAIVITTLPSYPFCCHEDLLMMSRSQLVQAAVMLNSHLPVCSQIELADTIPDAHIRHSIEMLVGIVPDMPGAPKAIKSRRFERMDISEIDLLGDLEQDTLPSPPTSPLSMRVSRRQEKALPVMSSPPHLLERLEEEDESDFFTMNRPFKKKRLASISMASILCDEDIDMGGGTPTRARRTQRMIQESSPSPMSNLDVSKVDSAFVNMKPRYRSMGKKKSSKKRKITSGSQPGSSRKPKQPITLKYRPFKLPTNNPAQYHMRTKPLSSTSTKSSNSSDEKVAIAGTEDESDNNTAWLRNLNMKTHNRKVEYEDNQVAARIENLTVGCD
jgi:hypothetical protein